jgi:hypothetical protein
MSLLAETPLRRPDIESFKNHIGGEWVGAWRRQALLYLDVPRVRAHRT